MTIEDMLQHMHDQHAKYLALDKHHEAEVIRNLMKGAVPTPKPKK